MTQVKPPPPKGGGFKRSRLKSTLCVHGEVVIAGTLFDRLLFDILGYYLICDIAGSGNKISACPR